MMDAFEKHYTAKELAELWGLSEATIRRMFHNEPGVLRIDRPEKLHKRGYTTLRIPASIAENFHKKNSPRK